MFLKHHILYSVCFVWLILSSTVNAAFYGVVTHGSYGRNSSWYQPPSYGEENFFSELAKQAEKQGVSELVSFSWSGDSGFPKPAEKSLKEHLRAAEDLADLILKKTPDMPAFYVGHSNGGVIGMLASHMLFNPHHWRGKEAPKLFKDFKTPLSKSDQRCRVLIQQVVLARQQKFTAQDPQVKIGQLILLATPHNKYLYQANMAVVGTVSAISSLGDGVAKTFSGSSRMYEPAKDSLNVRITLQTHNLGKVQPWHTGLMTIAVARSILTIARDAVKKLQLNRHALDTVLGVDVLIDDAGADPSMAIIKNINRTPFKPSGSGL
ncbi:hypothetical protein FJ366_03500 [Candidatus Dependentiae bacterium]|nr:hypothetical protein [Candidatus Dependentiae bacterium]